MASYNIEHQKAIIEVLDSITTGGVTNKGENEDTMLEKIRAKKDGAKIMFKIKDGYNDQSLKRAALNFSYLALVNGIDAVYPPKAPKPKKIPAAQRKKMEQAAMLSEMPKVKTKTKAFLKAVEEANKALEKQKANAKKAAAARKKKKEEAKK